ncbi:glycosyltransferase family 2 protein [Companilactobacillus mishanensis]|uniref:glycosyltransferase family 2 protein n=1 Tax=Companilactobacillus mishanensis TaxID=2486008 RepID=UPI001EE8E984|nr:glycosyltransferase family 2 protein [Companilactobacillus mishanensis]
MIKIFIFTYVLLVLSLVTFIGYLLWFSIFNFERVRDVNCQKKNGIYKLYIMVPLLNEENTIFSYVNDLINELDLVDQTIIPNIILIDDASDDRTLENIYKLQDMTRHLRPNVYVLDRHFPNAQQGKGAALNYGLSLISQMDDEFDKQHIIVGIVDADGFISAKHITDVIGAFENNPVGMVQTAVSMNKPENNWLSRMQDIEFLGANSFMQESQNRLGEAIASGNGQFITLDMAEAVGWGNSLLEDFEFTVRGLFKDYRALFLPTAIVYQEAVEKLRPLLRQRIRWCEGSMQCLFKYGVRIMTSPKINTGVKVDMTLFLFLPFFSMLLNFANISSILVQITNIFSRKPIPVLIVFTTVIVFTLIIWFYMALEYYRNTNNLSVLKCVWRAWQCIIYNVILSFIPYAALGYLLKGRSTWDKTAHAQ